MSLIPETFDHEGHGSRGPCPLIVSVSQFVFILRVYFYLVTSFSLIFRSQNQMHYGSCEVILFREWIADVVGAFIASSFGLFFIAVLYEGIRYFREYLSRNETMENRMRTKDGLPPKTNVQYMFGRNHIAQSLLHGVQIAIGYWLMLILMQFNFWLILSILLGAVVGYYFFAWMRQIKFEHCDVC